MGAAEDERLREYERGFRRAGLPLFIADRSAATDIFNRAVPLIGFVFLVEVLGALNLEWSPLANVAAVTAALAIFLIGIMLLNRARGRPARAIPQDVGKTELALFVIVPARPATHLRRAMAQRPRHRGRQPGPPRPDLRRRGARTRLDPALDAGAPRRPAPRLVRAVRARGTPADDLLGRPLLDERGLAGVHNGRACRACDPDRVVRSLGNQLPRRAPAARGARPRARGGRRGAARSTAASSSTSGW